MSTELIIIAHNIRSAHNVGSLLRTSDGLGVQMVYFTGYTPYPLHADDERLPHLSAKIDANIQKTALGAENTVAWKHHEDVVQIMHSLKKLGYSIVALEQDDSSVPLPSYESPKKLAILLGSEVTGIDPALLAHVDTIVEIPMQGKKESYNVIEATTMAMYHCRFIR